jgi:preprotein translocase subunit SecG
MSILINILLVIHVLVSLLIILLVLMQRPKNEGLGAAFGGGMTDNLFGAQTTNVLQSGTRWLGGIFFGLTLLLSFLYVRNGSSKNSVQKALLESGVPAATPAPGTGPGAATDAVKALIKKELEKTEPAPAAPADVEKKPDAAPADPGAPKPEAPKPETEKPDAPKGTEPAPPPAEPAPPAPPK